LIRTIGVVHLKHLRFSLSFFEFGRVLDSIFGQFEALQARSGCLLKPNRTITDEVNTDSVPDMAMSIAEADAILAQADSTVAVS
jgi:hypothetical protein